MVVSCFILYFFILKLHYTVCGVNVFVTIRCSGLEVRVDVVCNKIQLARALLQHHHLL